MLVVFAACVCSMCVLYILYHHYMLTNITHTQPQLLYVRCSSHVLYASLQCASTTHRTAYTAYVSVLRCYFTIHTYIIITVLVFTHISPEYTINALHMHFTTLTFHHHTCTFSAAQCQSGQSPLPHPRSLQHLHVASPPLTMLIHSTCTVRCHIATLVYITLWEVAYDQILTCWYTCRSLIHVHPLHSDHLHYTCPLQCSILHRCHTTVSICM